VVIFAVVILFWLAAMNRLSIYGSFVTTPGSQDSTQGPSTLETMKAATGLNFLNDNLINPFLDALGVSHPGSPTKK
jgi:hypothetical protein